VLVEQADNRGDLQLHTRLTDGFSTIAQMVRPATAQHDAYMAITDHSQALGNTGGGETLGDSAPPTADRDG
jgi:histidinol phosphatase-like PHP family hydrolase